MSTVLVLSALVHAQRYRWARYTDRPGTTAGATSTSDTEGRQQSMAIYNHPHNAELFSAHTEPWLA